MLAGFYLTSILGAEVQDGPYKGWPLGAAMAIEQGETTPAQAKATLLAQCSVAVTQIQNAAAAIAALPDEIPAADASPRA